MGAPAIYHYDPDTGELIGEGSADPDPVATVRAGEPRYFGPPAQATSDPPPAPQEGFARCYRDGAWLQIEDRRGDTVYDTRTGLEVEPHKIPLGPLPAGMTRSARPSELHVWQDGAWIEDAARKAQAEMAQAEAALFETDRASIASIRQALIALGEGRSVPADALAALKAFEADAAPHRAKIDAKT